MDLVDISTIIIPENRQRRDFAPEKIQELCDSIRAVGLMHPIVVRNDGKTLVAGERRLRALKHLDFLNQPIKCHGAPVFAGTVPVVKLAELSEAEVFEAELSENVVREDLTWQERAIAVEALQRLREMQTGKPVSHNDLSEEIHGRRDAGPSAQVHTQLMVAKHLDNPEIAKAKSLKEAASILKVRETQKANAIIGAALPPEILKAKHRLIIGDFQTADLPIGAFACTITDPPYGIGAEGFAGSGSNSMGALAGHTYSDSPAEWSDLMRNLALKLWGVGAENSHHYIFCDFERFVELRAIMESFGFRVWRTPFIMYRTTSTRCPWQESGPWKSYECILYAIKGSKICNKWGHDVITVRGDPNLGHGAQKPVEVYRELLERSARAGESVADLCCGTGTIFPAAQDLRCIATGVELLPQNAAIAKQRLDALGGT